MFHAIIFYKNAAPDKKTRKQSLFLPGTNIE
jgi:hypothetical protein